MKTAVVIIHGVGEQRPMDTLRGFVEAIAGSTDDRPRYYSKPDRMSELFELRRLQTAGRSGAHFYEYYWAYNVEGTSIRDVLVWLGQLAARRGGDVPPPAKSLWLLTRVIALLIALLAISGVFGGVSVWYRALSPFTVAWFAAAGAVMVFQYFAVSYLGDAARYLSPTPRNIRLRQKIRGEGVKLLRTLHTRQEYDRIVIVGHSLGSVIGYDIITHLWHDYAESLPGLKDASTQAAVRACLAHGTPVQPVVRSELSAIGEQLGPKATAAQLEAFRDAQVRGLREQRRLGHPWCITDFVTLGSPLTHAMLFLASSADDFEARKRQRELPTCPPRRDDKGYAYSAPAPIDVGEGRKFTPLLLHHAAPFAVTRWTNLFIPARAGLFGDIVGGPLAPALGYGIKDIPVRTGLWRGWSDRTLRAHLSYWAEFAPAPAATAAAPIALAQLRDTLALSRREAFGASEWPSHDGTSTPAPDGP